MTSAMDETTSSMAIFCHSEPLASIRVELTLPVDFGTSNYAETGVSVQKTHVRDRCFSMDMGFLVEQSCAKGRA